MLNLITGGNGMLGYALCKEMRELNLSFVAPTSTQLNLLNKNEVVSYIKNLQDNKKISTVFHLAAKVGGIKANSDFLGTFYDENILINLNVLGTCVEYSVPKVISILSTCVYPDASYVRYPLTEEQLHMGPPHLSNFGYAYAKRMVDVQSRAYRKQYGVKYITVIPNNMFGENDFFQLENSHVLPALMRKIWEAKINDSPTVEIWGDGKALREFTYSGDIAKILMKVVEEYDEETPLNIGNTEEYSIAFVAEKLKQYLEYDGKLIFNTEKPSGQFKKPSSNKKLLEKTSWKLDDYTPFDVALKNTCEWFKIMYPNVRGI